MTKNSTSKFGLKTTYHNWIGGEWTKSASGQTFASINPATEEIIAQFQAGNEEDIDMAVNAARQASHIWSQSSVDERASILYKIADLIDENHELLSFLEALDNGKPIRETKAADIPLAADHFRYFASVIRAEENSSAVLDSSTETYNYVEPLGVIGQIIPWNFPLLMAAWKLAPVLATGNCVVLKPAEQTPLTILELAQRIQHLIPPGVINIVTGDGPTAGSPLVQHPKVDKIAFTGSSEVGKLILEQAAKTMKPVTLELGGKSPNIVFDDAPWNKAIEGLVLGAAFNQGEVCTCGSRALVHESIYDKVKAQIKHRFEKIIVGDPLNESTMMGAQVSKEQYNKICSYLDYAQKKGLNFVTGGKPLDRKGYFIQPTIIETDNNTRIAQEEIFGPVLSLIRFRDEKEALEIANETVFGLGAAVWTKDVNRIYRMTRGINAGRVWVNNYHRYPAHAPFGGYKDSGIGRECHKMMLSAYRHNKNVIISYDENETGFFPA